MVEKKEQIAPELWAPLQAQEKDSEKIEKPSLTFLQDGWRRLKQNKLAMASMCVIILLVLGIKTQKMGKKIFGIVFAVTGLLGILSLTGVPYLEVGIPGILSLYFDVFSGGVQALVFSLLTMVYIGNACPPPEEV